MITLLRKLILLYNKKYNQNEYLRIQRLKNLKKGEIIRVPHNRAVGKIANAKVILNHPKNYRIELLIEWENYEEAKTERYVPLKLTYYSQELKDLNIYNDELYNPEPKSDEKDKNLKSQLQERLKEAESSENYELACKLRDLLESI